MRGPGAIIAKPLKVGIDALPAWILLGQHSPLASCHRQIQDGVHHGPHAQRSGASSWFGGWDQLFDTIPLSVSQIGWIDMGCFHIPSLSHLSDWSSPLQTGSEADQEIRETYELITDFTTMLRERQGERLDGWLQKVETQGIVELKNFAQGVKRDYDAVKAGLTLEWSNGQTEGQVNRLKLLKRQMYGRGRFDLLRKRVLKRA